MERLATYFLLFIIYSFLGWLLEVFCTLYEKKKFVNRGFLIGPICPIYGNGVLSIIFLIGNHTKDLLGVFLKSLLICSILEYFTSYIMEKLFKARWWDYSKKRFNINGRSFIPAKLLIIIAIILLLIYILDNIISINIMSKIRGEIKKHNIDNTELIKKKVVRFLENNTTLYHRVKNAYPKFKIRKSKRKINN